MKQTAAILTALMIALLLVSGFVMMGSMQQSAVLLEREEQLQAGSRELEEKNERIAEMEKQAEEMQKELQQLQKERDAMSSQLSDALLSSQESNDAVAQQVLKVEQLQAYNSLLKSRLEQSGQRVRQLEEELEKAPEPHRTPSPLYAERSVRK